MLLELSHQSEQGLAPRTTWHGQESPQEPHRRFQKSQTTHPPPITSSLFIIDPERWKGEKRTAAHNGSPLSLTQHFAFLGQFFSFGYPSFRKGLDLVKVITPMTAAF